MPRVTAAPGLRVPHEDNPRKYIDNKPVDVADTAYYRRRLATGELLLAKTANESTAAAIADKSTPTTGSRKS